MNNSVCIHSRFATRVDKHPCEDVRLVVEDDKAVRWWICHASA